MQALQNQSTLNRLLPAAVTYVTLSTVFPSEDAHQMEAPYAE